MKRVLLRSVFDAFEYVMDHYYPFGLEELAQRKDSYAVISIQDTHTQGFGFEFTESKTCEGVLTLYFDDVIRPVEGLVCFSDADAEEILDFVEAHRSAETLLVHCYGGESRSRAVAAAVVKLLGGDNSGYFRTGHPNELVFGMLNSALQRKSARPTAAGESEPGLRLIEPTMEYDREILDFRQAFLDAGCPMDGSGSLLRCASTREWLDRMEAGKDPAAVAPGRVPATQYVCVRETDGAVVGVLQIRHFLNEALEQFAGHVGYSVRPDERRKGYGTRMLHDALPLCRSFGIKRALVCCRLDNEASRGVILNNGGVFDGTVWAPDRARWIERYWIETPARD